MKVAQGMYQLMTTMKSTFIRAHGLGPARTQFWAYRDPMEVSREIFRARQRECR